MYERSILDFVKKLLSNLHVSTCVVDASKGKIPSEIDLGLRALLYGVDSYESVLRQSLTQAKSNVVYRFCDEYHCNYIFVRLPNSSQFFFIGPYLTNAFSKQTIENIYRGKGLLDEILAHVHAYYNNLPILEDENLLLGIVNCFGETIWDSAENFRVEYVEHLIADGNEPIRLLHYASNEKADLITLAAIEEHYKNEKKLMSAVARGELHKVSSIASSVYNNGTEERVSDSLRNRKNYLIILNTLLRKAAENGGVPPYHIHVFSSTYAKKIENVHSIAESLRLQSEMIREYCIFVRNKSIKEYSFYVGRAITIISCDLTADLSLKAIASSLNVNPSYLSALFSKERGCTLTDYVHEQRLQEGLRLLTQTDKTVSQIATECGFNDAHYFIRCFKKKLGTTPLDYRKNNLT